MKRTAPFALIAALCFATPVFAQDAKSEVPMDEVIARATKQNDPAMSAWLSGDYETAEIEFNRNAFCALRAERNFRSGVEAAQENSIQSDVSAGAGVDTPAQPLGGQGTATPSASFQSSTPNINSQDLNKDGAENRRTCDNRAYQIYMAGLSQLKLGKMNEAKASFSRATSIRKTLYDAHFRLALMEYQDGNLSKAKKQYQKLQKIEKRCRKCEAKSEIRNQVQYLQKLLG